VRVLESCAGVLIPDGSRHCFVTERGLHHSGRPFDSKELSWTVDHIIPKSLGGSDELENMQVAHLYCQKVQGGLLRARHGNWATPEGSAKGGRTQGRINVESGHWVKAQRLGRAARKTFNGVPPHLPGQAARAGRAGNHSRWHVTRGVVNPECVLCVL